MPESDSCNIVVLGGGDHGRVVVEAIRLLQPRWKVVVLDPDPALLGRSIYGAVVIGGDELLPGLAPPGGRIPFAVGIGGIVDLTRRQTGYEFATGQRGVPMRVVHPGAIVSPFAELGEGAQILAGAVVNPGAVVGINAIINTAAVVEHDCHVGAHSHVASNATLAGNVRIGERTFVGAGAIVRQGIVVGADVVVGAGAVVVRDVPPGQIVVGVPARPLMAGGK